MHQRPGSVARAASLDSRRWLRNSHERKAWKHTRAPWRCASEASDTGAARGRADARLSSAARRPHRQAAAGFQRESDRLLTCRSARAGETQRGINFGLSRAGNASAAKLAKFFGVRTEELLLTNGTDEALSLVVNTFVEPEDECFTRRANLRDVPLLFGTGGSEDRRAAIRRRNVFPVEQSAGSAARRAASVFSAQSE